MGHKLFRTANQQLEFEVWIHWNLNHAVEVHEVGSHDKGLNLERWTKGAVVASHT